MIYALSNLPTLNGSISGTSTQFSYRTYVAPLNAGEIIWDDGAILPTLTNPIFDASLVNPLNTTVAPLGFGGVRSMTQSEQSALSTQNQSASNQLQDDIAWLRNTAAPALVGYVNTPSTIPAQATFNVQVAKCLLLILRTTNLITGDQQQPM